MYMHCTQLEFGLNIRLFVVCVPVELFDTLVLHACESEPLKEESASGCDVLPPLNLLCQWMAGSSPSIWNGEMLTKTK